MSRASTRQLNSSSSSSAYENGDFCLRENGSIVSAEAGRQISIQDDAEYCVLYNPGETNATLVPMRCCAAANILCPSFRRLRGAALQGGPGYEAQAPHHSAG